MTSRVIIETSFEAFGSFHLGDDMKNVLLASFAAFVLASGSALAADMGMPMKAPPAPPPAPSWTGCFVGAGGGYGLYDLSTTMVAEPSGIPINVNLDQGGRGWLGMGSVGCDYQFSLGGLGSWVIGAFGDGEWADIHGAHTGLVTPGLVGLVSGDMKMSSQWDVGGRIGYLVTPALLTYWDGGYTEAHFGGTNYLGFGGGAPIGFVGSSNYNGYFIGGGTEYAFTWLPISGLFWKSEYRFSEYSPKTLIDFALPGGAPIGQGEATHPYVQTITTELVYRFNWAGVWH
jgi:outer membrane immunogenic protein